MSSQMKLWPNNYKGQIPVDVSKSNVKITTPYFRQRDNAVCAAQYIAYAKGFSVIYDVEYIKETDSEPGSGNGTHYFTVWKINCRAGYDVRQTV